MRKIFKVSVFFVFFIFLGLFFASSAFAVSPDCTTCHGTKVADFNYPNVPSVDRLNVCWKCHNDAMGLGIYLTESGWFSSFGSPSYGPEVIHPSHAGNNIYGGTAYQSTKCGTCHGPVDCNTCHTWGATTPTVPHATHPSSRYSPLTHSVSDSITRSYKDFYCTRTECHTTWTTIVKKRPDGTDLCLNCHSDDKSASNHIALHAPNPTLVGTTCISCHQNNLPNEHTARGYDCNVCHGAGARQEAKNAIANYKLTGQTAGCPTCHTGIAPDLSSPPSSHTAGHIAPNPTLVGTTCISCHQNNLPNEHTARGYDCNVCHGAGARQEAKNAIANYKLTGQTAGCPTCHTNIPPDLSDNQGHRAAHDTNFDTSFSGATSSCSVCHNLSAGMIPYDLWDIHIDRSTTSYPAGMDCNSCHGQNQGGKLGSVVLQVINRPTAPENKDCKSCHVDRIHQYQNPEFNASYHPTYVKGMNSYTLVGNYAASLINGWTPNSIVGCDDCHASGGTKANMPNLIKPYNNTMTEFIQSLNDLCFICHNPRVYTRAASSSLDSRVSGFSKESLGKNLHPASFGDHDKFGCSWCHDQHGSKKPRLIGGAIKGWKQHTGNYTKEDCFSDWRECDEHKDMIYGGSISGRLFDGNDNPLSGVSIKAGNYTATTNSGGEFLIYNVTAGSYTVTASKSAYPTISKSITVANGQTIGIRFILSQDPTQMGTINGKVTDENNLPITGATIDVGGSSTTTDSQGNYSLYLYKGTYLVTASKSGYTSSSKNVTLIGGDTQTADFVLQKSQVPAEVYADNVIWMDGLRNIDYDKNIRDITNQFKDGSYSTKYVVEKDRRAIAMKLNQDASLFKTVKISLYVNSLDGGSEKVRIYAYKNDGKSVDTTAYVDVAISANGWVDIDVSSLSVKMSGYSWMKFRITDIENKMEVSEGKFKLGS